MSTHLSEKFRCPITKDFYKDPVTISDGFSYEKSAIITYLEAGNITSPITGEKLVNYDMIPNLTLKDQVKRFLKFDRLDQSSSEEADEDLDKIEVEIKPEQQDKGRELGKGFSSGAIDIDNNEAKGMIQPLKSEEIDLESVPNKGPQNEEITQNQRKYLESPQKGELNISKHDSAKRSSRSPDRGIYQNTPVVQSEDQFHFANRQNNQKAKNIAQSCVIPFCIWSNIILLHVAHARLLVDYFQMDAAQTTITRDNQLWGLDITGIGFLCFLAYDVFIVLAWNKMNIRRDYVLEGFISFGYCFYPLIEGILIQILWFQAKKGLDLIGFDDINEFLKYCFAMDIICFIIFAIRGLCKIERVSSFCFKVQKKTT
jgi:U-box domain